MKRRAASRIVSQELGTDHHLAIANLAECSGVLRGHADRGGSFLRQAGIVKDQDAIGHRMQFQQPLHARLVQFERIPGGIGEQVLQTLKGGSGDHIGDGFTRLVREIAQ